MLIRYPTCPPPSSNSINHSTSQEIPSQVTSTSTSSKQSTQDKSWSSSKDGKLPDGSNKEHSWNTKDKTFNPTWSGTKYILCNPGLQSQNGQLRFRRLIPWLISQLQLYQKRITNYWNQKIYRRKNHRQILTYSLQFRRILHTTRTIFFPLPIQNRIRLPSLLQCNFTLIQDKARDNHAKGRIKYEMQAFIRVSNRMRAINTKSEVIIR